MRNLALRLLRSSRWTALTPWLVAALCVLATKCFILSNGGFHDAALCLGLSSLSFPQKLSLLRADLILCCLLMPLALLVLGLRLPPRIALLCNAVLALPLLMLVCAQFGAYEATGAFISASLMRMAVSWAASHHASVAFLPDEYFSYALGWTFFCLLCSLLAAVALLRRWLWMARLNLVLFATTAAAALLCCLAPRPRTVWTSSLLWQSVHAATISDSSSSEMSSQPTNDLLRLTHLNSLTPEASPSPLDGRARGYNVLFFVMESMSAHALNPATEALDDLPNLRRLRQHSLLMERHYTSYPLTNYAVFSIFTSMYATSPVGAEIGDRQVQLPSIIRTLRSTGYQTGYYGFVWDDPAQRDDRLLDAIGFEKIAQPALDPRQLDGGSTLFAGSVEVTADFDRQSLQLLRRDIHLWSQNRQPFAAAYFPELSHDPYRQLPGQNLDAPLARGHALAVYQDAWLGQLIDDLEREHQLDRTIIVVTGDHGMRYYPFTPSSPDVWQPVARGKLEDVTMHVPMMIYLPRLLRRPMRISQPTSHIDIVPTLQALLGLPRSNFQEGASVLNQNLESRRLFLFSNTFGASGYFQNGHYYMRNRSDLTYKSPSLEFRDAHVLPYQDSESDQLRSLLARQESLQRALLSHLLGQSVSLLWRVHGDL